MSCYAGYDHKKVVPCLFLVLAFSSAVFSAQENNALENTVIKEYGERREPSPAVIADGYEEQAAEAVAHALELRLSDAPYWHTLLHYKPAAFGHYKSLVDDPYFFMAADGKKNPEAELIATINGFFSVPPKDDEFHAIRRFPGRYAWLKEQLNLTDSDFPYDGDIFFRTTMTQMKTGDLYLVFPAGYMKNPASVFGHTFLLVEYEGKPRLLANAINYGAVTQGPHGLTYMIRGLFGAYNGYYGFIPYYEKIKQYANIDMRDMWEYRLVLTEKEKERLLRHTFDMSSIYSKYFFISENCSYNLLFLIEAACPETRITQKISGVVEPVETVKLIYEEGLTDKIEFRPSLYKKIQNNENLLTARQNRYVKAVCRGRKSVSDFPFQDIPAEKQIIIWDTAADYLSYLLSTKKITPEEYRPRLISVLSARRKLGKNENVPPVPLPSAPHNAHGSKKIAFQGGHDAGGAYIGTQFRLSAHEQLEKSAGYSDNSQISFISVDARFHPIANSFVLKKADFADIISLPASDCLFINPAIAFSLGAASVPDKDRDEHIAFRLKALPGLSVQPFRWVQLYALAGGEFFAAAHFTYGVELLLGGECGFITTAGPWKNKLSANVLISPIDTSHLRMVFSAEECVFISQNFSLKGGYSFHQEYNEYWHDFFLAMNVYF